MDFTVEFVSRNLVTQSNFVEFRDSRIFTKFEAIGIKWTPENENCEENPEKCLIFKEFIFKIDETETGTK